MTDMPHLTLMQWDFRDQLSATSRQVKNDGTPETTFYVYDASGQRVRKVTEGQNGTRKKERIYLGGFEVFREYDSSGTSVKLERETLHVMDDKQRIALVETRTQGNDGSAAQLIRYQFGNHLGSASLELDDTAQVISYEEYYPFGSTSYQAVRRDIEIPPKRYRFTAMERDEETGLNYHRARYYATWLGSWVSCDPIGLEDGINIYKFSQNNPIIFVDLSGQDSIPAGQTCPAVEEEDERCWFEEDALEQPAPEGRQTTEGDALKAKVEEATGVEFPGLNFDNYVEMDWDDVIEMVAQTKECEGVKLCSYPSSKPSFAVSIIPAYGSIEDAKHEFRHGHTGWGLFYTGLAITDVIGLGSVAKMSGKAAAKGGTKLAAKGLAERAAKELAEKTAKDATQRVAKELTEKAAKELAEKAAKELAEKAAKELAEKAAKEAAEKAAKEAAAKAAQAHAKTLEHIFGQARHKLGNLVKLFGSEEKAFNAVQKATEAAVQSQGINGVFTNVVVTVGTESITVRGNVINGIVRIGTFFKP
jgi:RHS repeat-associated protein